MVIAFLYKEKTIRNCLLAGLLALMAIALKDLLGKGFLGSNLHLFGAGIASFYLLKWLMNEGFASRINAFRGALLAALIFIIALARIDMLPFLIWVIILYIVVATHHKMDAFAMFASRMLNSRPVQKLGKISFSIYLSHMIFLSLGMFMLNQAGLSLIPYSALLLLFTLAGTLIVSWISYFTIEKPAIEFGKKFIGPDRKKITAEQAPLPR